MANENIVLSPQAQESRDRVIADEGELDSQDCVASATAKYSGFPWQLVAWVCEGYAEENLGECDALGYYSRFNIYTADAIEWGIVDAPAGWIVREDDQGFTYFESYATKDEHEKAWQGIQRVYADFYDEQEALSETENRIEEIRRELADLDLAIVENGNRCPHCASVTINSVFTHEPGCCHRAKQIVWEHEREVLENSL